MLMKLRVPVCWEAATNKTNDGGGNHMCLVISRVWQEERWPKKLETTNKRATALIMNECCIRILFLADDWLVGDHLRFDADMPLRCTGIVGHDTWAAASWTPHHDHSITTCGNPSIKMPSRPIEYRAFTDSSSPLFVCCHRPPSPHCLFDCSLLSFMQFPRSTL